MINREKPHIFVLPEDGQNRQIANGFLLEASINQNRIDVLREADGWCRVVEDFNKVHAPQMRKYQKRIMVLLIDFDEDAGRLQQVKNKIPEDLSDRVFVIGVFSEPQKLKNSTKKKSFEAIGQELAENCANNTSGLWEHDLLIHNKVEMERILSCVKPFLFEDSIGLGGVSY